MHLESTTYAFYSDVDGTVSEFKTITLTSPLNNTYSLGLSPEGDQWGSAIEGEQSIIEAEFPNGTYTFDVTFADESSEVIAVELSGDFPPYPENVALSSTQATWDEWVSPTPLSEIEVEISENNGAYIAGDSNLPATDTSFSFTDSLMLDTQSYDLGIWFVTETQPSAFKASITKITTPVPDVNKPNTGENNDSGGGAININILSLLLIILIMKLLKTPLQDYVCKIRKIK